MGLCDVMEMSHEVSKVYHSNLNFSRWKGGEVVMKIAHVREVEALRGLSSEVVNVIRDAVLYWIQSMVNIEMADMK